jgi:multiple sugar transport system permease protein
MAVSPVKEQIKDVAVAGQGIVRPKKDSTEQVNRVEAVVRYALYIVITVFLFIPFVMTVLSSFKSSAEVIAYPPTFIPSVWHPENYVRVFSETPNFPRQVFNSFLVTFLIVVLNLFLSAMAGYGFSRLRWPGREVLFAIMLGTMVIPGFVFFVPRYIGMQQAHLINTYGALLVLYFVQPTFIFLFAQFFRSIPRDLEEAALMDGLGWFGIFWRIIMPIARPALLTVGILAFQGAWNNFFDWLIFMQSPEMFNIQLGLQAFQSKYQNQWDLTMAGSVIAILPILILFIAGARYFTRGIATTGLK